MSYFKTWQSVSFCRLMLRASDQYTPNMNSPNKQDNDEEMKFDPDQAENRIKSPSQRENVAALRNTTTTKKHKEKNYNALINVDVSASQKKQMIKNIEFELSYYQSILLRSLLIKYNPDNIF